MLRFPFKLWLSCSVLVVVGLTASTVGQADPIKTPEVLVFPEGTTVRTYAALSAETLPIRVTPISDAMREEFKIPTFYSKGIVVRGIPAVSSDKTSDYALLECAYTLDHMFADSPQWVRDALTKGKTRMAVMSSLEYTMDLPENQQWQTNKSLEKMAFWDERARGMGGFPDASCAEENLLNLSSDPYHSENITIHEFSHTLASALEVADPQWYKTLVATYKKAIAAGLFANSYAASNEQEYWAEGAQAWFDCAVARKDSSVHNGIWNREQLKTYDPDLAKLLTDVYGDGAWRYVRTDGKPLEVNDKIYTRPAAEIAHLDGLERSKIPPFNISDSPRVQALRASQQADGKKEK